MINAAPRHDIAALCRVASFTLDRLALRGLEDRDEVRLWLDGAARWSAAAASLSELAPATRALRRLRGRVHVGSPMSSMVSVCEDIRRQMSMADARPIPTLRLCRSIVSACDGESKEAAREMVSRVFWASLEESTGGRDGDDE